MKLKLLFTALVAAVALGAGPLRAAALADGEWYVRLILTSEAEGLKDQYNLLGQLNDAAPGFDSRDLPELGQTWAGTYLSVIFYRPDWETDKETFNTDFHPVAPRAGDEWTFEVRSDDPSRDLSLTWSGKNARFNRMVLVDLEDNQIVRAKVDGVKQVYHFRMNGVVREFAWRLLTGKEYQQFLASGELPPDPAAQAAPTLLAADQAAGTSLRTADQPKAAAKGRQSSGWLPLGWGQGEGQGYRREALPAGLPADPFGD
ncbi:MAG: hypothetical protein R3E50_11135 [Halioglobus sp.]